MRRTRSSLGIFCLVLFVGCATRSRMARPEPPALTAPGTVTWKPHVGETFVFEYPEGWDVQTPAGQDAALHIVRLHSESGFHGQFTVLRNPPAAGTFAAQVVEQLRKGEEGLTTEPFSGELAGVSASGHRFSFKRQGMAWSGWVLTCTDGKGEVCALGRWPAEAVDLQQQWSSIVRNLRVKGNPIHEVP